MARERQQSREFDDAAHLVGILLEWFRPHGNTGVILPELKDLPISSDLSAFSPREGWILTTMSYRHQWATRPNSTAISVRWQCSGLHLQS